MMVVDDSFIVADKDPVVVGYRPAFKDLICAVMLYLDPDEAFDRHDLDAALGEACMLDLREV